MGSLTMPCSLTGPRVHGPLGSMTNPVRENGYFRYIYGPEGESVRVSRMGSGPLSSYGNIMDSP